MRRQQKQSIIDGQTYSRTDGQIDGRTMDTISGIIMSNFESLNLPVFDRNYEKDVTAFG